MVLVLLKVNDDDDDDYCYWCITFSTDQLTISTSEIITIHFFARTIRRLFYNLFFFLNSFVFRIVVFLFESWFVPGFLFCFIQWLIVVIAIIWTEFYKYYSRWSFSHYSYLSWFNEYFLLEHHIYILHIYTLTYTINVH